MRKVVPIKTDVDVEVTRAEGDEATLEELARAHRLVGPLERLSRAMSE
jgi:hypothetical protein